MLHLQAMRDRLERGLRQRLTDIRLNGHPTSRLPNTLSMGIAGIEANRLLAAVTGVAASSGAACHADTVEISSVLTTAEEIDRAIDLVGHAVEHFRHPTASHVGAPNI
jgi:cysteine desulfurase